MTERERQAWERAFWLNYERYYAREGTSMEEDANDAADAADSVIQAFKKRFPETTT